MSVRASKDAPNAWMLIQSVTYFVPRGKQRQRTQLMKTHITCKLENIKKRNNSSTSEMKYMCNHELVFPHEASRSAPKQRQQVWRQYRVVYQLKSFRTAELRVVAIRKRQQKSGRAFKKGRESRNDRQTMPELALGLRSARAQRSSRVGWFKW